MLTLDELAGFGHPWFKTIVPFPDARVLIQAGQEMMTAVAEAQQGIAHATSDAIVTMQGEIAQAVADASHDFTRRTTDAMGDVSANCNETFQKLIEAQRRIFMVWAAQDPEAAMKAMEVAIGTINNMGKEMRKHA